MERAARLFLAVGALSAGLAVIAGAFGAHGLEGSVTPVRLAAFETAALYHFMHALALLAVGLLLERRPSRWVRAAGILFLVGTVLFAGSLYALVLTDTPRLGIITPMGGTAFIAGWGLLALGIVRAEEPKSG
ncbi:MAG: DUF423 domain-containing protein [Bacteroidota bacterium]